MTIPQSDYTLVYVNSEELVSRDQRGEYAFDSNPSTFWHSEWLTNDPAAILPHEIQIDLDSTYSISAFRYLPRTDGGNGNIKDYEFYVSDNTANWGHTVVSGTFPAGTSEQEVSFPPQTGRYIRLVALSSQPYSEVTVIRELNIIGIEIPSEPSPDPIPQSDYTLVYVNSEELVSRDQRGEYAFDSNPSTFWHSEWLTNDPAAILPHEIQIDLDSTYSISAFRYLPRTDGGNGNIKDYEFYVSDNTANWGHTVVSGTFPAGTSEQEVSFPPQTGRYIRLVALSSQPYSEVTVIRELNVIGAKINSSCQDNDNDGYDNCNARETGDDGKAIDCDDNNSDIHPNATEVCGNNIDDDCDGNIDENCDDNFSIIPQNNWKLLYVNSQELVSKDQKGEYAFDNNKNTFWHSEWLVNNPDALLPHEIQIDLGSTHDISGFTYLPRTDGGNGNIKDYQFYVSDNTADWGQAVITGTFPTDTSEQTVSFNPKVGRYVRIVALSSQPYSEVTVIRELNVIGAKINSSCQDSDNDSFDTCNIGETGDDGKAIDCDDNNIDINPGKDEICDNNIDDNCDGNIDEDCGSVNSIKLNGVELVGLDMVPTSALNIDGNNEICIKTSERDTYRLLLALHMHGMTYRELDIWLGSGTDLCKQFNIPDEKPGDMSLLFKNQYNIQVIKGAYSVPTINYIPYYILRLNLDNPEYDLSNSTLNIPLVETYNGIDIYSNANTFEINTVKEVIDYSPIPMQTKSIYLYDINTQYDVNVNAFPTGGNFRALSNFRTLGLKAQSESMNQNGILNKHKSTILHELAHVHTSWTLHECSGVTGIDCSNLSLSHDDDPRFYGYQVEICDYDFAKLTGGYPSWYSMKNSNEYISELVEFVFEVYLNGESINVEHISPDMKKNIDLLNSLNYFKPELYAAVNDPSGILPSTSKYRLFSSDFPIDDFRGHPVSEFPNVITVNGITVFENGVQLINELSYAESFEVCVDFVPEGMQGEYFDSVFDIYLKEGVNYLQKRGEYVDNINNLKCKTVVKHPATLPVEEILVMFSNQLVDDSQYYGGGNALRGGDYRIAIQIDSNCLDFDKDGYDSCAIGETGDDGKEIDCDDNNIDINPGKDEICGNSIDEDCDGSDLECPVVCVPDGCNNNCPINCAETDDPDCGTSGCCGDGTCDSSEDCLTCSDDCGICLTENTKLSSKYPSKQAFLISDKNWQDVLPLVPVTVWTGNENWCQRGYGTPGNVCVNPVLIYHEEDSGFDADSIIYFMQQYSPDKLTIVGDIPQDLSNLLIAEQDFGAGLSSDQINSITTNDYFSYWVNYNSIIYVEDNYELALLASTYASLVNAPLVIQGTVNDADNIFVDKNVICIGSVIRDCNENYDLEQLQQKYVDMTNTDKIILVNPDDLNTRVEQILYPEKSLSINELYSKTSLAAPILAGAKHEIILSIGAVHVIVVDNYIKEKIINLKLNPNYLTVMAAPNAIQYKQYMLNLIGLNTFRATDQTVYSDFDSDGMPDISAGRIQGMTLSDVSSYVARDLFYESIGKSNNVVFMASSFNSGIDDAESFSHSFENAGYNSYCAILPNVGYGSEKDCIQSFDHLDWIDKDLISYDDHGFSTWAGISCTDIPLLSNSIIFNHACSTCSTYSAYSFCNRAIRQGALIHIGAVKSAWSGNPLYKDTMSGVYYDNLSIGQAFMKAYPKAYELSYHRDYLYFETTLFGDPTLRLNPDFLLLNPLS